MAAPVEIEDANWHRSKQLHKECGWKHGDSAIVNLEKDAKNFRASRCAAISNYCFDIGGLLMEVARDSLATPDALPHGSARGGVLEETACRHIE